jgi:hypothetical protein
MKTLLFILLITIGLIILTGMMTKTKAKTETQKFKTIYKEGNFEIRYYPEAALASVTMEGYDNSRNSGFRILAEYIFGGNSENQKISMTSPVRISNTEQKSTMSFVLPSKLEFDQLPEPLNKDILLHRSKPVYAAVIQFGGYASSRKTEKKMNELKEVLKRLNLQYHDNLEYLGYNPPYQIVNRKNEVLAELTNFNPEESHKAQF